MTTRPPSAPALGRRQLLVGAGVLALGAMASACGDSGGGAGAKGGSNRPEASSPVQSAYGDDEQQFGELHLPAGSGSVPVVVLVHGGFWLAEYGLDLMDDLAADVASRGWAAWNVEYRRVGQPGGGWPGTFADVAGAVDHLDALRSGPTPVDGGERLDLKRVAIVGHSAGGQLAAWVAGRAQLPADAPGADPKVGPMAVVSLAGVLDLVGAAQQRVGGSVVPDLLSGSPEEEPERYDVASPLARLPIGVPVRCSHGRQDSNVPFSQSQAYVDAAKAAGDPAELAAFDGDHFDLIDPSNESWSASAAWLAGRLDP